MHSSPGLPAPPTRRAVVSWILYDLANTIFSMGVISVYFPEWLKEVQGDRSVSINNQMVALSMGIIFVVSPLLGAMTDRARRRLPFLTVSTLICVLLTSLLTRVGYGTTLLLFVAANIAYQAGVQFYDALLPEVSTEENRGWIGGLGVGFGYLGAFLAVGFGWLLAGSHRSLLFPLIALSFLAFALPCMLFVRERGNPHPAPINFRAIRESTARTLRTLRSTRAYPGLGRFLIGRVFYTDAINTVIGNMALFVLYVAQTGGLGIEEQHREKNLIFFFAIGCAVIGGLLWGRLVDRWGPKRTLNVVLITWLVLLASASAIGLAHLPIATMYPLAIGVGIALGGTWAADRPYMLRLTPPDRVGEFYGLYGMVGRFSAITGPVVYWLTFELGRRILGLSTLQGQGLATLTLLAMVAIGMAILRPVSDRPRDWAALGSPGEARS